MSYDLTIVTPLAPQMDSIRAFLSERRPDAAIEGQLEPPTGHAVISAPKRSLHNPIFMIDGPFEVEVEDIQDDIAAAVLAPRWLLEINVPIASSDKDLRLAKALSSFLAQEFQGAAYDPQDEAFIWPKRRKKRFRGGTSAERISIVTLSWEMGYAKRDRATAERFVETIRKYCFECLPRRFGSFEPLLGKIEHDDFGPFFDLWEDAAANPIGGSLFFSSTAPCFGGHVGFSDPRDDMRWGKKGGQKTVRIELDFDGRAFDEQIWSEAVVGVFIALARRLSAFYALAYLEPGAELRGSRLSVRADYDQVYPLPRADRWLGIPPVPAWLTWFGPPYSARVRDACEGHVTTEYPEGFLLRQSREPADIDTLADRYPTFPIELQAKLCEQTLSRKLASVFPPEVPPTDPRMNDGPADLILSLE